jgi:hypothetical protein
MNRRINAARRPASSTGVSQLDVNNSRPSRLTGRPIHHWVDVAAPPRLNATPSAAGAPAGTVSTIVVVVVVDVVGSGASD